MLTCNPGTPDESTVRFSETLEVGRRRKNPRPVQGRLTFDDQRISRRHCVITRKFDGRWWILDLSRSGTWINNRRLVPNVEVELQSNIRIQVGDQVLLFTALADPRASKPKGHQEDEGTQASSGETEVTVLVGDIEGYASMTQTHDAEAVYSAVHGLFRALKERVVAHKGAIKEYQVDGLFSFWEDDLSRDHAKLACRAALDLDAQVQQLAATPGYWPFDEYPLRVQWALATGDAVIRSMGSRLAMVGDVVNYAFRLEKLAGSERGNILMCATTKARLGQRYQVACLGEIQVKGRKSAERVYRLIGHDPT